MGMKLLRKAITPQPLQNGNPSESANIPSIPSTHFICSTAKTTPHIAKLTSDLTSSTSKLLVCPTNAPAVTENVANSTTSSSPHPIPVPPPEVRRSLRNRRAPAWDDDPKYQCSS
ncbi:hypothetical protein P691DRAFT_811946 [Macrolepiota fuliginosa MF-IS2]|uniref:Uncharacterized protein n=1 Tax=Macrolepiota fuliginosa MF-IS2 TaxID=1400762 RepID=A0A9P5X1X7_9AGAR|nr:hypothetical protein P691DRAFT_811946 [Macrolepiota fuliginosa MF-IS2]